MEVDTEADQSRSMWKEGSWEGDKGRWRKTELDTDG